MHTRRVFTPKLHVRTVNNRIGQPLHPLLRDSADGKNCSENFQIIIVVFCIESSLKKKEYDVLFFMMEKRKLTK